MRAATRKTQWYTSRGLPVPAEVLAYRLKMVAKRERTLKVGTTLSTPLNRAARRRLMSVTRRDARTSQRQLQPKAVEAGAQ